MRPSLLSFAVFSLSIVGLKAQDTGAVYERSMPDPSVYRYSAQDTSAFEAYEPEYPGILRGGIAYGRNSEYGGVILKFKRRATEFIYLGGSVRFNQDEAWTAFLSAEIHYYTSPDFRVYSGFGIGYQFTPTPQTTAVGYRLDWLGIQAQLDDRWGLFVEIGNGLEGDIKIGGVFNL